MRIVAIEGPSLAGKSTLLDALKSRLPKAVYFSCYVESLASDNVPVDPGSTVGQVAAFRTFARIELNRVSDAAKLQPDSLILLDRSIDTLLAHANSLDHLRGYDSLRVILAGLEDHSYLTPDLSLYLDTPNSVLQSRLSSRSAAFPSELIDPSFLKYFRQYFTGPGARSKRVVFVQPADDPSGIRWNIGDLLELVQGDESR